MYYETSFRQDIVVLPVVHWSGLAFKKRLLNFQEFYKCTVRRVIIKN